MNKKGISKEKEKDKDKDKKIRRRREETMKEREIVPKEKDQGKD